MMRFDAPGLSVAPGSNFDPNPIPVITFDRHRAASDSRLTIMTLHSLTPDPLLTLGH
jgi:hypothetical protein